jgi:hypothetical protein
MSRPIEGEVVDKWTSASIGLALAAFLIELLWLGSRLPMTSDQGQVLMGIVIAAWFVVTICGLVKSRSRLLLIGVPFALFAPVLVIGGIILSCALGDCI